MREPADILHFVVIDIKPVIDGDAVAADHQRRKRKARAATSCNAPRPRARPPPSKVSAPHGIFHGLAGLHETGEA